MKSMIFTLLVIFGLALPVWADPWAIGSRSGEEINWQVISSGGTRGTSINYMLTGTAGQMAAGPGSSTNYNLYAGFWQDFAGAIICDCEPGNCDGLGALNMLDILYLIAYLYKGGPAPTPYTLCSGDPDKSCTGNMLDILYLIAYLYKGGPMPSTCEDWLSTCGPPLRTGE
jgi:hypothetical protein